MNLAELQSRTFSSRVQFAKTATQPKDLLLAAQALLCPEGVPEYELVVAKAASHRAWQAYRRQGQEGKLDAQGFACAMQAFQCCVQCVEGFSGMRNDTEQVHVEWVARAFCSARPDDVARQYLRWRASGDPLDAELLSELLRRL